MNKKYIIGFISFIFFLIIIFYFVIIYSSNRENVNILIKIEEEISYIERKLVEIMNSLNDISFHEVILLEEKSTSNENIENNKQNSSEDMEKSSDSSEESESSKESSEENFSMYSISKKDILTNEEQTIRWDLAKKIAENLYSVWTTVIIDLHSEDVQNEDILNFSENYNLLIVYIGQENKIKTLNTLLELYSYIPKYLEQTLDDIEKVNLAYTRLNVVSSYVLAEEEKWDEMKEKIDKAQEYYGVILNSINDKSNQNKLSNIYVSLNETYNAIDYKDRQLYYIKYVDLMEKLFDF